MQQFAGMHHRAGQLFQHPVLSINNIEQFFRIRHGGLEFSVEIQSAGADSTTLSARLI
jgi:hypothetical protein